MRKDDVISLTGIMDGTGDHHVNQNKPDSAKEHCIFYLTHEI